MKKSLLIAATVTAGMAFGANAQQAKTAKMNVSTMDKETVLSLAKKANLAQYSNPVLVKNVAKRAAASGSVLSYALPQGNYFISMILGTGSEADGNFLGSATIGPAFHDITFKNTSEGFDSFEWTYYTFEGNEEVELTSTDKDLKVNYPFCFTNNPVLRSNGQEYQFGMYETSQGTAASLTQYGGSSHDILQLVGAQQGFVGVQNFDPANFEAGWGFLPGANDPDCERIFEQNAVSYGYLIPKPEVPYALGGLVLHFTADGDLSKSITVNLRSVEETAQGSVIGEAFATATVAGSEFMENPVFASQTDDTYMAQVLFKEQGAGGLEKASVLTISDAIYVEVTAPQGLVVSPFAALQQGEVDDAFLAANANCFVTLEDGTMYPYGVISFSDQSGNTYRVVGSFMALDLSYSWLKPLDGTSFEVPVEGGSKDMKFETYYSTDSWKVTDSANAIGEWLNYEISFDEESFVGTVSFTVDQLPAEVKDRYSFVTISEPGSSVQVLVQQGDGSSVEGIDATTTTVRVVGNNFVVNSDSATAVEIYNIAGQKVAAAAVNGETVVPAGNLANGVYVVKFDNNRIVKVLK